MKSVEREIVARTKEVIMEDLKKEWEEIKAEHGRFAFEEYYEKDLARLGELSSLDDVIGVFQDLGYTSSKAFEIFVDRVLKAVVQYGRR